MTRMTSTSMTSTDSYTQETEQPDDTTGYGLHLPICYLRGV